MHSLGGPGSFQEAWKSAGSAPIDVAAQHHQQQQRRPSSVASLRSPQPPSAVPSRAAAANFQILPPPIFSQPDQTSSELTDTLLEEVKIAGFVVGGETRLCLPQILNTVLSDKELSDINTVCDDLAIYMPQCSSLQLKPAQGGQGTIRIGVKRWLIDGRLWSVKRACLDWLIDLMDFSRLIDWVDWLIDSVMTLAFFFAF